MSASSRLDQAQSMHPKIRVTVPLSYLSALSAPECSPAVLVRLPPALFIDPNTFPSKASRASSSSAQVVSLRHLNSEHASLSSYDFTKVEIEGGVGYSDPSGKDRGRVSDREQSSGREVKRLSNDRYVAASKGKVHSRFQDQHADAQRPLAKEHRAALLTLRKTDFISDSNSAEVEYDSLTGKAKGSDVATTSIEIPIHSRYVEPIEGTGKWTAGNYEEVLLDKPEVFWMCQNVEHPLDSSVYDQIDASDLLPSPHSHLSLQLPSNWHFYRLKMDSQDTSLKLTIPAGDVSIAPFVHLATFVSLIVAVIWVVLQIQAVLDRLNRAQAVFEKKASGKAD